MSATCPPLVIRADAQMALGTGHVLRCFALAQAWRGPVHLATAALPPTLRDRLAEGGVTVHPAGAAEATAGLARQIGAEWVVVDGYAFDGAYERSLRAAGLRVLAFDDHVHAEHEADIVLNQNIHAVATMYSALPRDTRLLLGTRYASLRREFLPWRGFRGDIPGQARKVLVTLGGTDPDGVACRVVAALARLPAAEVTIVSGGGSPHLERLQRAAAAAGFQLVVDARNMPELMAAADVAVASAGTTAWELLFMGLPSLCITLADNQRGIADGLGVAGAAEPLGWHAGADEARIAERLQRLMNDAGRRRQLSETGRAYVDGEGGPRVVAAMLGEAEAL